MFNSKTEPTICAKCKHIMYPPNGLDPAKYSQCAEYSTQNLVTGLRRKGGATMSMKQLAQHLAANHYFNANGCWITDYSKIKGLRVLASTTNGTSGIGKWDGRRVYWSQNLDQTFTVELASR